MKKLFILSFILFALNLFGADVDTFFVQSAVMAKTIPNVVIKPVGYGQAQKSYPVLYLLHGAGGNYSDWVSKVPEIRDYSDQYNMVIVCPDAGVTSWYFDSPIDETMQYETYMASELVDWVDVHYKTIAHKKGRAISGLSMGGHGALYLAFRHQDIWGAAGSMSGGVDIRPFPNNWDIAKRLGSYKENKEKWEENTVMNLAYLLDGKSLSIIFDCGVDDFFYSVNKRLHEKMLRRNIPHDYVERPGNHNWDYWRKAVKYQVLFFFDYFKS